MTCGPTGAQILRTSTNVLSLSAKWSLCFCGKLTSLTSGGVGWVIWKNPGGGDYTSFLYTNTGTPRFQVDVGTIVTIGGGNMGTANWEWFGFAHDGAGTVRVYRSINGAAPSLQLTQAVAYGGDQTELLIMNDESVAAGTRFRGQLYGYKEWQDELSLADFTHECFKISPTHASPNRFIPAFNNATAIQDYSGNGRNMTKTGTLTDSTLVPPSQYGGAQAAIVN